MTNIYVIKCENEKYYIGKSFYPENRVLEHFLGNGSEWTKKYKPVEIIQIIKNADNFDEDKYTKIYMSKYGIDNVRGGTYCQIKLSKSIKEHLNKELLGASDKCYLCGQYGHFIKNCNKKYINCKEDVMTEINLQNNNDIILSNQFFQIISKINDKVLDISEKNYSDGAKVICYHNIKGTNQIWTVNQEKNILSYLNNFVLDIDKFNKICVKSQKQITSQKWKFFDEYIINESNGLALINRNDKLYLTELNYSNDQKWCNIRSNIKLFS
ncbi:GIY-YIG nuclease and ricin-type beta-trefoil lectin domain protein [Catovirus CTV1]|uniref:GIY-YIG nuclease and ricin-type beta-trefoil lectin domain protein n=1 Tax=Catovirus CTV1 TaxID=1977631 RepID=A0A1V0SB80_9VIRU|nr:GIY-YIG nuclease and ricin-type beta-trefoil lectin domain protein [Catovirus CTV1]